MDCVPPVLAVTGGKAQVHTLLDALNNMATVPERKTNAPLRLPISGAYKIKGVGDVLAGRVEQGEVKPGDEVIFLPTHTVANPCFGKVSAHRDFLSCVMQICDAWGPTSRLRDMTAWLWSLLGCARPTGETWQGSVEL